MITSLASDRATVGQVDAYLAPFDRVARNPVVWCHGKDGDASQAVGVLVPSQKPILSRLTDYGLTVVAPSTGNTWGNATGRMRVADVLTWARTLGATSGPVIRLGTSHGACACLQSGLANLSDTACIVLFEPTLDLQYVREQDTVEGNAGLRASIDTAWAVAYPAALPTDASPLDIADDLANIPIQLWYATDDDISHGYDTFAAAHGNTELHNLGALGHTDAALAAVDATVVAEFINTYT